MRRKPRLQRRRNCLSSRGRGFLPQGAAAQLDQAGRSERKSSGRVQPKLDGAVADICKAAGVKKSATLQALAAAEVTSEALQWMSALTHGCVGNTI